MRLEELDIVHQEEDEDELRVLDEIPGEIIKARKAEQERNDREYDEFFEQMNKKESEIKKRKKA